MTWKQPFLLELTIQVSRGFFGRAGELVASGRFCMQHSQDPNCCEALVQFVGREQETGWSSWHESVGSDPARLVAEQLEALGMPARVPDLEPVFDTSSTWTNLVVWVKRDGQSRSFEIGLQSSGFEGPDADGFRRLLRSLCALSGYRGLDYSVLGSASGEAGAAPPVPAPVANASSGWTPPRHCCYCGHLVDGDYPEDGRQVCANANCGEPLLRPTTTCIAVSCGHVAPVSARFCWVCGADVRDS